MIETPATAVVRKRKAPHQPVNMEDIKIEFVDLCVAMPSSPEQTILPLLDLDNGGASVLSSPPLTPMDMDVTMLSGSECGSIAGDSVKTPRKRRKLDHLSPEEKSQHRKMMNRMSAQSARDRQKMQMQQQDVKIQALQQTMMSLKKQNHVLSTTTQTLKNENTTLKQENSRLAQLVQELEAKLQGVPQQQFGNLNGIVKQETEDGVKEVGGVVFEVAANADDMSGRKCNSGSSPSEPAVLRTIPLQKGSKEEPLHHLHSLSQPQQQQPKLSNTNNPAVILLLLMSYLGIWTHLKSCKSLETSLNKFSAEISNSSEKSLNKLKILLDNWLQMHNLNNNSSSNQSPLLDSLKTEMRSPIRSPTPG